MAMVIIKQSLIMMVIITAHLIIDISSNSAELSRPFTRPQRDVVLAPKFYVIMAVPSNIRVCPQLKLFSMHHEAITWFGLDQHVAYLPAAKVKVGAVRQGQNQGALTCV